MWQSLKNIFFSIKTYRFLSPDLSIRRQVNRVLRRRPALSLEEWFEMLCQPLGITKPIANFVYTRFQKYSGLNFAHVTLSDRLYEDLQWSQICWFDWETTLCEDFWQTFGIDISDAFYGQSMHTIGDLVSFLNEQLTSGDPLQPDVAIDNVNSPNLSEPL